jgi:amidohydrolase
MADAVDGLTERDAAELTAWRRALHAAPEVSRREEGTAAEVARMLRAEGADRVAAGLGGNGVAGVFEGAGPGPTVMLRAELDALPIAETGAAPHRSRIDGVGHMCGHDGHMAILAGAARMFARARPGRGRVVLMFQPAEEDGSGAAAVIADPAFDGLRPDWAFALHNMPGLPLGAAALAAGPANCASVGMAVRLTGRTAHASSPWQGVSPGPALARLIPALGALGRGLPLDAGFSMVTVTHARLGEPTFGVAPGEAELFATLRTLTDAAMRDFRARAEALARAAAEGDGLGCAIDWRDDFAACANDPDATAILVRALDAEGAPRVEAGLPMLASEDFGRFGAAARSAMFLLGAGEDHPSLHNPDYDFPDALIPIGARVLARAAREIVG